jgi:hypothetical protein
MNYRFFLFLAVLVLSCDLIPRAQFRVILPPAPSHWLPQGRWEWKVYHPLGTQTGSIDRLDQEFSLARADGPHLLLARLVDEGLSVQSSWSYYWSSEIRPNVSALHLHWDKQQLVPALVDLQEEGFPWFRLNPQSLENFSLALDQDYIAGGPWVKALLEGKGEKTFPESYIPLVWDPVKNPPGILWTSFGDTPEFSKFEKRGAPLEPWFAWGTQTVYRCVVQDGQLYCFEQPTAISRDSGALR